MLLGALVGPLVRACTDKAFLRAFPRTGSAMIAFLVLYAIFLAWAALSFPVLLRVLAIPACGVLIFAAWRIRPQYGRSRKLPPGSLPLLPLQPLLDYRFYEKQADRHGPVFKTTQLGSGAGPNPFLGYVKPVFCVVGLRQGAELLRRHDSALIPPRIPFSRFIPKGFLRFMDPATHAVYRRVFQATFTGRVIQENEEFISQQVRQELLQMSEICEGNPAKGVRPETHLIDLTFGVFARLFFGIPAESIELARLRALYQKIAIENDSDREVKAALAEISALIRQKAQTPSQGAARGLMVPRCFLSELIRHQPEALEDPAIVGNLIYIMQAAWIDLSGLLLWIVKMLVDHPDWVVRIRDEKTKTSEDRAAPVRSLAHRVVLETLRLEQSEYLYRTVLNDISFGGFVIPRGWLVRICVREAHSSSTVFEQPERFDPDRFLDRQYSPAEYSPFGASRIMCLGEDLTMTFGRILASEAANRFGWTVVSDGPREFRRWHWKPSSKFRVCVTSRSD